MNANFKFYAGFENDEVTGATEEQLISMDVYPAGDANLDAVQTVEVTVVMPVGYTLTDKDYADIDSFVQQNA